MYRYTLSGVSILSEIALDLSPGAPGMGPVVSVRYGAATAFPEGSSPGLPGPCEEIPGGSCIDLEGVGRFRLIIPYEIQVDPVESASSTDVAEFVVFLLNKYFVV